MSRDFIHVFILRAKKRERERGIIGRGVNYFGAKRKKFESKFGKSDFSIREVDIQ